MDSNHTVYASFVSVPTATLTFDARYGNDLYVSSPVPANLYMDDELVGLADGSPIIISVGTHTFSVDLLYYQNYADYYYFNAFVHVTGAGYPFTFVPYLNNPVTIDVEEDANFFVWYFGAYAYPPKILTVQSSQNGYAYAEGVAFAPGEQVEITAFPNQGYELANWTVNDVPAGENNPLTVTMNTDQTVTANFDVFCHVNLQSGLGGSAYVVGGGTRFLLGQQASINVTNILQGFLFANWTVNGQYAGDSLPLNLVMDQDYVVVANFVETVPHCFLTVQSIGDGYASAPLPYFVFVKDTVVPVTAYPQDGYGLDYWMVDGVWFNASNPLYVTMDVNHTVVAYFNCFYDVELYAFVEYVWQQVEVEVYIDGFYVGTTFDPAVWRVLGGNHSFGVVPYFYVEGWPEGWCYFSSFIYWPDYMQGPLAYWGANAATIDIQSDIAYFVGYSPPIPNAPLNLTVSCIGGGSVSSDFPVYFFGFIVPQDYEIYLSAVADDGYEFSHWTLDGNYAGTNESEWFFDGH
jgi:hypothetical protein